MELAAVMTRAGACSAPTRHFHRQRHFFQRHHFTALRKRLVYRQLHQLSTLEGSLPSPRHASPRPPDEEERYRKRADRHVNRWYDDINRASSAARRARYPAFEVLAYPVRRYAANSQIAGRLCGLCGSAASCVHRGCQNITDALHFRRRRTRLRPHGRGAGSSAMRMQ